MMRRLSSTAGFSALELTMVMFIITLATTAVFVWGHGARERARQASCTSNIKQLGLALSMYAADHNGWYPPSTDWAEPMNGYVKNAQVFQCPSDMTDEPEPPTDPTSPEPSDVLHVDYAYRPGLSSDDMPQTLILWDDEPARHSSRTSNAVRLDGGTVRLTEDQWPGIPAPPVTPETQTGGQSQ